MPTSHGHKFSIWVTQVDVRKVAPKNGVVKRAYTMNLTLVTLNIAIEYERLIIL